MACNNTTYSEYITNHTELFIEFHKNSYFVSLFDYHIPNTMVAHRYVTLVWVVIGIFGNIVSALVWANPRMRTCNTAAYYLTCLSIADLTFLVLCFIYELENPWLLGSLDLAGWCQIFNMANMSVQYFCVFLVFAFTVERFLSMCFPFKSERFGKTRTPKIIMGLLSLAILMGIPQTYFWSIQSMTGECNLSPSSFYSMFTWLSEMAVFGLLPVLVLLFNIAVLMKIRSVGNLTLGNSSNDSRVSNRNGTFNGNSTIASERNMETTHLSGRAKGEAKTKSYKGTTVTLLWVSFFLILTMLPNTVVYIMQQRVKTGFMPCRKEDMLTD
ncbi:hypothetical protein EGW08_020189, partial [Elysia chlorotica]